MTQAFCCGTTLTERATKMAAMTNRMTANSISFFSSDFFEHEPAAVDVAHAVRPRPLRRAVGGDGRPDGAAIAHLRGVVRGPRVHVDPLAGIEVEVGARTAR